MISISVSFKSNILEISKSNSLYICSASYSGSPEISLSVTLMIWSCVESSTSGIGIFSICERSTLTEWNSRL